jgi:integrase
MPMRARAWFRTSKNAWYATVDGRKVALGVKGRENKAEARKAWHRLMADGPKPKPQPKTEPKAATLRAVIDGFLADAEARVSAECLRNYRKHLLPFKAKHGHRPAVSLTVAEAESYARRPEWSPSYRNGILGSLVSAYRWAERTGLVAVSPLRHLRKPPKTSRGAKALICQADHERLCEAAQPSFRAFLKLLWLTGARPGEIAGLTAADLDLAKGVAVLSEHKTAHLGKVRIIFLCPEAVGLLRPLVAACPSGLLFPGQDGGRLTVSAITCRFTRLCKKAGVKCIAYGYRHTFATTALANGVPDAQVAALMGHSGTAMLHRHYSHLTAQSQALREALGRVRA